MNLNSSQLTQLILAIGALGTAAFGLVDAFKALPGGGVSHVGFSYVKRAIGELLSSPAKVGLSIEQIRWSLKSQWINGVPIPDQLNIAKSLIKMQLTPDTAESLAKATGVDGAILKEVATLMLTAKPLLDVQKDVYGRFDLALTTLLDQAYQRGEQKYRNAAKACAVLVAVVLACVANRSLGHPVEFQTAVLIGLIATPIAPVAKDIASAVQTASKAIQAWKG